MENPGQVEPSWQAGSPKAKATGGGWGCSTMGAVTNMQGAVALILSTAQNTQPKQRPYQSRLDSNAV